MTRNIALLGSTGSIGRQTLEVLEALGPDFRVAALTANKNYTLLAQQVRRYKPDLAVLSDRSAAEKLSREIDPGLCRIEAGAEAQVLAATWPGVDLVVAAQVGFSGFAPVVAALKAGKTVALSNKESLVVGGELLEREGLLKREKLLPVDSEHSAIWQCLGSTAVSRVHRIWLTASGGPFRDWPREKLSTVTPQQALNHPNWSMGPKITVDSATLMNKGFEVLEARWLFGLDLNRIEVVIHPQSIVHSAVEYVDGSVLAQLGLPDMRTAIQYALTFPDRRPNALPRLNLFGQKLTFYEPDRERFPCLELAFQAGRSGGTAPACLNAANEVAVDYFLLGKLNFTGIPEVIDAVLQEHRNISAPGVEEIVAADQWARQRARELIENPRNRSWCLCKP